MELAAFGRSVIPVDGFSVGVELHLLCYSHFLEHLQHIVLLLGRHGDGAAPAVVVGITSKVHDEGGHETVVLLGIHAALEIGEAMRIAHWVVAAEVGATVVSRTVVRVQETHVIPLAPQLFESDAVKTHAGLGTLGMYTNGVVVGSGGKEFS